MLQKQRFRELDIMRAVGALAVIVIHVTAVYGQFPADSARYLVFGGLNRLCSFAVPLFLFLSALQLTCSARSKAEFSVGAFYKRRFLKTVPVYIVSVVAYYLYLRACNYYKISILQEPGRFFGEYFLQGKVFYHLYFMPLIFQLYLLFPLLLSAVKKLPRKQTVSGFVAVFAGLCVLQALVQFLFGELVYPHFQNSAILLVTYTLAVGLGVWIGANYDLFRQSRVIKRLSLAGMAVFGCLYVWFTLFSPVQPPRLLYPVYTACASIAVLSLSILIGDRGGVLNRPLQKIGKHSFAIYLVHPMLLDQLMIRFPGNLTHSNFSEAAVYILVQLVLVFVGAYLAAVLLSAAGRRLSALFHIS